MSMFLPEGTQASPNYGAASVTPPSPETTTEDIALMQRVLSAASRNPNLIPSDFMAYVLDFIQTSRLQIPIGQVFGFMGFTTQQATGTSIDLGVTATTFADFVAASGPVLSAVPAGRYLVIVSCDIRANGGAAPRMGYSVNGAAPDVAASCANQAPGGFVSVMKPSLLDLMDAANTLTAQRQIDAAVGNGDFGFRSIVALKWANL